MSLLKLMLATRVGTPDPPPDGGGGANPDPLASNPDAVMYAVPTSAPWNSPQPVSIPTYDGSGEAIHPSVIDFGASGWKGWRYWMAYTPYPANEGRHENPCIAVSQNGYYWQLPVGAPDPLYPAPPEPGFGSDTHLVYDPVADQLVMIVRQTLDRVAHTICIARSSDGVTWPANLTPLSVAYPDGDQQTISPALVRVAANDWRLFGLSYASKSLDMWKATTPEGPWAGPYRTVGVGISGPTWNWHLDVNHIDGVFRCLIDRGPVHEGRPDAYRPSSSPDGLTWTEGTDFMTKSDTGWDSRELYRACMIADEAGTHFRIWYSANKAVTPEIPEWGTGYTKVPRTLWPAPPTLPVAGTGTAYRTLALSHGSAVMWRMGADPLTTSTEPDATGNSRTGTYAGRYVRSVPMTGESGYASRIDQGQVWRAYESWMAPTDYTIRLVIKPGATFSGKTYAALHGANGGWRFKAQGGFLQFVHTNAAGTTTTVAGGSVAGETVAHVAVTVTAAGAVTIYKNGASVGTGTVSGAMNWTGARLAVGGYWDGTQFLEQYQGHVEYFDLCPTALSGAQIAASSTEALT